MISIFSAHKYSAFGINWSKLLRSIQSLYASTFEWFTKKRWESIGESSFIELYLRQRICQHLAVKTMLLRSIGPWPWREGLWEAKKAIRSWWRALILIWIFLRFLNSSMLHPDQLDKRFQLSWKSSKLNKHCGIYKTCNQLSSRNALWETWPN